jgi:hypothetical protein
MKGELTLQMFSIKLLCYNNSSISNRTLWVIRDRELLNTIRKKCQVNRKLVVDQLLLQQVTPQLYQPLILHQVTISISINLKLIRIHSTEGLSQMQSKCNKTLDNQDKS